MIPKLTTAIIGLGTAGVVMLYVFSGSSDKRENHFERANQQFDQSDAETRASIAAQAGRISEKTKYLARAKVAGANLAGLEAEGKLLKEKGKKDAEAIAAGLEALDKAEAAKQKK